MEKRKKSSRRRVVHKSTKRVKGETSLVPLSLFQAFAMEKITQPRKFFLSLFLSFSGKMRDFPGKFRVGSPV